jgi:hypothetical protein
MDDGDQILDGRAEPHAEFHQPDPFRGRHFDPLGQLAAKDPILGLQGPDVQHEVFFGRPGDQHEEGVDQPHHVGTIRKSLVELEETCFWDPATPALD